MKSRSVDSIAGNEDYVRLRIFDGDLQISEAGAELLRLEKAQHEAERKAHRRTQEALAAYDKAIAAAEAGET